MILILNSHEFNQKFREERTQMKKRYLDSITKQGGTENIGCTLKSTSKQIKALEDRGLSQKSPIFVFEWRQLCLRHVNDKKRCAFLASVKPEKLNNRMTRMHGGTHAIAWAAITISSYIGFLRAYTRRRGIAVPRFVV